MQRDISPRPVTSRNECNTQCWFQSELGPHNSPRSFLWVAGNLQLESPPAASQEDTRRELLQQLGWHCNPVVSEREY